VKKKRKQKSYERTAEWSKAYQSPLNGQVENLRAWRRARMTWAQIREKLLKEQNIKVSPQWVQKFFERSMKKNRRVPLGFEPEPVAPTPKPSRPAPKPVPPDALGVDVPHGTATELFKKTKKRYGK
jgi:hypothetical protein